MNPKYAGIDVSAYQKDVDFNAVKAGKLKDIPISFVFIRVSAGKGIDSAAVRNINAAIEAGLDVGVYHYSTARNKADAKAEAESVLKFIRANDFDGKITLPVVMDFEENEVLKLGKDVCTDIVTEFLNTIAAANYQPMLYTYAAAYNSFLHKDKLKEYPLWIAGYIAENALNNKFGITDYAVWQFGVAGHPDYDVQIIGKVDGVKGQCDCDYMYEDLTEKIKIEGKNKFLTEIPEENTPTGDTPIVFDVGQIVHFLGGEHYGTANNTDSVGGIRTEGQATITAIAKGAKHPYHLRGILGGSNVYGWVDADTIEGAVDKNPVADDNLSIGDKVKIKAGTKDLNTKTLFASWVYDKTLFVREITGNRVLVSTQTTGAITGAVNKQDLIKIK